MISARKAGPGTTIYSVAAAAGVSIASVSRVLQGSTAVTDRTRDKVLAAAAELNYVPHAAARSLAVRQHEAHGLVLPELTGPYYSELLAGFESRAAELGQSVVLLMTDTKDDLGRAVRAMAARVDALALLGSTAATRSVLSSLNDVKPVLLIASDAMPGVESIASENHDSSRELTLHLIEHGRQRLLFVGEPDGAPDVHERYRGFVSAHGAAGRTAARPVRIPFRETAGAAFADRLLAGDHDADALVCANDELALSIMHRLQSNGRAVPEEVAVVGWDDVMTARYVRPGLTTVRQPVRELGELAADRLFQRLQGAVREPGLRTLPTELVVRRSCGCTGQKPQPPFHSPSGKRVR